MIHRDRQRERAALMRVMFEVGGSVGEEFGCEGWVDGGMGVDVPDVEGERGRESGKCVI